MAQIPSREESVITDNKSKSLQKVPLWLPEHDRETNPIPGKSWVQMPIKKVSVVIENTFSIFTEYFRIGSSLLYLGKLRYCTSN